MAQGTVTHHSTALGDQAVAQELAAGTAASTRPRPLWPHKPHASSSEGLAGARKSVQEQKASGIGVTRVLPWVLPLSPCHHGSAITTILSLREQREKRALGLTAPGSPIERVLIQLLRNRENK